MQVWNACEQANTLRFWWGQPRGATMPYIELDFRVGGSLHFRVELGSGEVVWGKAIYKEIVPLEKIVIENHFSNEQGELLDSRELPASIITVTLTEEGYNTKITIHHEGLTGSHTIEEYKAGWTQSLERLAMELINQ